MAAVPKLLTADDTRTRFAMLLTADDARTPGAVLLTARLVDRPSCR